jgi:hypothetical protein
MSRPRKDCRAFFSSPSNSRIVDQAHGGEHGNRFAGPALADQPQNFAGADRKGEAIDGTHDTLAGAEIDAEIANVENRRGVSHFCI